MFNILRPYQFISLVFLSVVLIFFSYTFWEYDSFILSIAEFFHKLNHLETIKTKYYTYQIHQVLQILLPLLLSLFVSIIIWFRSRIKNGVVNLYRFLQVYTQLLIAFVLENKLSISISILIILASQVLLPTFVDEASTFNSFTSKSIFISWVYYPTANNHVLYSMLTNLFSLLPISDLFAVRLPNLLIFLLTIFHVNHLLKTLAVSNAIRLLPVLFLSFYPAWQYSVYGRGYLLYMLSFIILLDSLIIYLRTRKLNYFWYAAVAGIMGCATIPSFLYALIFVPVVLYAFDLIKSKDVITGVRLYAVIGLGTLLFYLPLLMISGIENVVSNPYVKAYPRSQVLQELLPYMLGLNAYLIGLSGFIIILILIVWVKKSLKDVNWLRLAVIILFPVFIMLIHARIPFYRTWVFMLPILFMGALWVLNQVQHRIIRPALVVIIIIINGYGGYSWFYKEHMDDLLTHKVVQFIQSNEINTVFSNYHYSNPIFRMAFKDKVRVLDEPKDWEKEGWSTNSIVLLERNFPYDTDWLREKVREQKLDSLQLREGFILYY